MTSDYLSMKLRGNEMLKEQLKRLSDKARRRVSRKALKESAAIVEAEAKSNCPIGSGALMGSIKTKVTVGTVREQAVISAGDAVAWYAHLVEFGFVHTGHGRRGQRKPTSRGVVEGKAFLRNAIESTFEETLDIFEETLAEVVLEELGKGQNTNNESK